MHPAKGLDAIWLSTQLIAKSSSPGCAHFAPPILRRVARWITFRAVLGSVSERYVHLVGRRDERQPAGPAHAPDEGGLGVQFRTAYDGMGESHFGLRVDENLLHNDRHIGRTRNRAHSLP